jgi:hypothetical protein
MKITIVFKNGYSLSVTCESFAIEKDGFGQITGYQINGIKDCKPLYISFEDVLCVYRDIEAEDEA